MEKEKERTSDIVLVIRGIFGKFDTVRLKEDYNGQPSLLIKLLPRTSNSW